MKPPVVIFDYDPMWPILFRDEMARILAVIRRHVVGLEHIGSTAVTGLAAKATIDLLVGVRQLDEGRECIAPLAGIGYEYVPEYEQEIPDRRYFHKGPPVMRTFHIHMVKHGGDFWQRHLRFRDYLRTHPGAAREYERLKRELAATHGADREGYTDGKAAFVAAILAKASDARPASRRNGGRASRPRAGPPTRGARARP